MDKGYVIKNMPGITITCQGVSNSVDRVKIYMEMLKK